MSHEKILLVTQETGIAPELEAIAFPAENFEVILSCEIEESINLIMENTFKVAIVGPNSKLLLGLLDTLQAKKLSVPVVLLCHRNQATIPVQILSHAVHNYIYYPFVNEEVFAALQGIVQNSWSEAEYSNLIHELSSFNVSLEDRIREATILQGIGQSASVSLDLDAVLNRVVEAATFITKAEEGYLMLLEEESSELYLRAAKNMGERRATITRQQVNDSIAGTVVQSGKPIILSGGSERRFKVKTGYIVHSLLNVPIKIGGRVIGVLGVDNPNGDNTFTLDDLRRLAALADNAATTIENARIYSQTSQNLTKRIEELDLLQSLARDLNTSSDQEFIAQMVLSQALKTTEADVGVLGWLGEDKPLWVSQGALSPQLMTSAQDSNDHWWDQAELEAVINQGQPRLVGQLQEEAATTQYAPQQLHSRLAVPIKYGKSHLGIINLESVEANAFSNDDLRFLQSIANFAALALQSSALTEKVDYHKEQLSLTMKHTKDAVWVVNTELKILDINPIACQLLGWQAQKVIGKLCSEAYVDCPTDGHQELSRYFEQAMAMGESVPFSHGVTLSLANGRTILIEGDVQPILKHGRVIGAIAIFRQVSPDRDAERVQADFIAMASHNLRTPLMSIQASLDYILEADGNEQKNKQLLVEARSQSQKIATFLRELLDVSRLALGKEMPLKIRPVNFSQLLKSVKSDHENDSTHVTCILDAPSKLPLISADEAKVEIILNNLIAHAKRRSIRGDTLKISVVENESEIIVSVLDNGTPIPPQQHQQIFWQIYPMEADKLNGSMPYGYSIGLFTTRRLVELLGGSIWVSQSDTKGAGINFTLPIWR